MIVAGGLLSQTAPLNAATSSGSLPVVSGRTEPARPIDLTRVPRDLPVTDQLRFITGRSFFNDSWVRSGATTTLRDGLGPLYSARSCVACHQGGGRSSVDYQHSFTNAVPSELTLRFDDQDSLASDEPQAADLALGSTWQAFAIPAAQAPDDSRVEGEFQVRGSNQIWLYPDGSSVALQRPHIRLINAPATPGAMSARVAPGLELLDLIEAVSPAAIVANADPDDSDQDGISGRIHPLLSKRRDGLPGRFGLKARHPGLRDQVAAALQEDIGITSSLRPQEACGPSQLPCQLAPDGRGTSVGGLTANDPAPVHEISDDNLSALLFFLRHLTAPQIASASQLPESGNGSKLFIASGCASCHMPELASRREAPNSFAAVTLYSDLLLHDMGQALADEGLAAGTLGREWRTAPLRLIHLRTRLSSRANYLHDGRARSVEEAILWHGGEARAARTRFSELSRADRQTLLRYIETR